MNIEKIYEYKEQLQKEFTFEEISKLYRECIYDKYGELESFQEIHCYQLLRDLVDIFTQIVKGREFDEDYLKDKIKW